MITRRAASPPYALYSLLLVWALLGTSYYVCGVYALYEEWFQSARIAQVPFNVDDDTQTLTRTRKAALAAGLADGDFIVEVNGAPYTGEVQTLEFARRADPGDEISVTARSPDGRVKKVRFKLGPMESPDFRFWGLVAFLTPMLVIPLLGLAVGVWVVFAKPGDLTAWLVLVLLTFPETSFGNLDWTFYTGIPFLAFGLWHIVIQILVFPSLLWFGFLFPERWRMDVAFPWFKWAFLLGGLGACFSTLFLNYTVAYHAPAFRPFVPVSHWNSRIFGVLEIAAILLFLIALFDKLRSASSPDARRRLRVLTLGSSLSLGPMLIVFGLLPRFGIDPQHGSMFLIVIPLIVIFPLTLAYVLIVQRAMDVRLLLRMGTKYVLARATLIIVQVVALLLLITQVIRPLASKGGTRNLLILLLLSIALAVLFAVAWKQRWRPRVQQALDRRFFREAYDAEIVLRELSAQARQFTEVRPLIEMMSRRIADVLHAAPLAVLLRDGDVFRLAHSSHNGDSFVPLLLPESASSVRHLVHIHGPATLYREDPDHWFLQAGEAEKKTLDTLQAELLVPLPGRGQLMGVMTLGPKRSDEPYSASDLRLLESVGTQAGLTMEVSALAQSLAEETAHRERLHSELEIAREVQQRLFPKRPPKISNLDVAGLCQPAQSVGGDYYDFVLTPSGWVGLAIGDVAGKGVPAALLMSGLQASLRALSLSGSGDLAELMGQLNRLVYDATPSNRFATFFYALYEPDTRRFQYSSAGHNPALLFRSTTGQLEWLRTPGPGLGLTRKGCYQQAEICLEQGDLVVLYTDGVTEARNIQEEEFGDDRLAELVRGHSGASAAGLLAAVLESVAAFAQGAPQHDDITIIVARAV